MSRRSAKGRSLALAGALGLAALGAGEEHAQAHGGLPITQRILRAKSDPTLYVPVFYWGLWVGEPDGSWRWICEEAINLQRFRRYAVSNDGATLYATDTKGLTVSRLGGCDWSAATGEIAQLRTLDLAADPIDAATAYVAAGAGSTTSGGSPPVPADNGLFVTRDRGLTFTRLAGIGTSPRLFDSVRVAPSDATVLYASSTNNVAPFDHALHRSTDGGLSFSTQPLMPLGGRAAPSTFELLAIDPRAPEVLYARAGISATGGASAMQLLLRSVDGGVSFTEVHAVEAATLSGGLNSGINDVAFDLARDELLVATATGLLKGSATPSAQSIALTATGGLSRAQCVDVFGQQTYACSWNYEPDNAAIASGANGAATLSPLFRFDQTKGPISCATGTTVGDQCGVIWSSYADQLGVGASNADGGVGDGGEMMPREPDCSIASGAARPGHAAAPWLLTLLGASLLRSVTPRRPLRPSSSGHRR